MTVVRVLGALGKTVIAIGIVILLFGIFQLWGTGVIEARAQQGLDSEFSDLLEASSALGPAPGMAIAPAPPVSPEPTPTPAPTEAPTAAPTIETAEPDSGPGPPTPTATPTPSPTATPQPTEDPQLSDEPHPEWLAMLYREWGSAMARIQIPRIGVDKTVVEGVRVSDLRKGPGHYPNTPLPGQTGNAAIAGHRTTYGAPFGDIDKVLPGDEIIVTTIQGDFTYQVLEQGDGHGYIIVAPTAVEVLRQDFSDSPNRLTLTACHPKGSARQRIIVVAELVGDPAPTYPRPGNEMLVTVELADEEVDEAPASDQTVTATPAPEPAEATAAIPEPADEASTVPAPNAETTAVTEPPEAAAAIPDSPEDPPESSSPNQPAPAYQQQQVREPAPEADSFGEGLDGDSDALVPAILWGLAALAVWFSAQFAGRRWRRLPAYALCASPFLVVLFMAFWHIDRILPSY